MKQFQQAPVVTLKYGSTLRVSVNNPRPNDIPPFGFRQYGRTPSSVAFLAFDCQTLKCHNSSLNRMQPNRKCEAYFVLKAQTQIVCK